MANIWEGLGPARHAFWLHHCLKLLYLMFHMFQLFQFPIILVLCLYAAYNSGIILTKIQCDLYIILKVMPAY